MNRFDQQVSRYDEKALYADGIDIVQVNVGLQCNQACAHCHLEASPERDEVMSWTTMKKVLQVVEDVSPKLVDITGGAPELNPDLSGFIDAVTGQGAAVQVRTNLSVLEGEQAGSLMDFFRERGVALVGSLPCYLEENVTAQRGEGTYARSVKALQALNELGYGTEAGLPLSLVYNPGGAWLPGDQSALEADYRRELKERFGIRFTRLLTIANMPIGRFGATLRNRGKLEKYMELLSGSFNPETLPGLMCRRQISVRWDGALYDCDFNLALDMAMNHGAPDHIDRWDRSSVAARRIVTGRHCFGCTAGAGSSCGGAIADS